MASFRDLRPKKHSATAERFVAPGLRSPLQAATVLALVVAAAFLLLAQLAGSGSGKDDTPAAAGFLAEALGAPQSAAPLRREPATGVSLEADDGLLRVRRAGTTIGLVSDIEGAQWRRFDRGAVRSTPFGEEAVVFKGEDGLEQFLTVTRRQGLRTWRWRLETSGPAPTLSEDGSVDFFGGSRSAGLRIAPVEILDLRGAEITPEGLRWAVARHDGAWWLELRLDDRGLPLPYVIDPAITRTAFNSADNQTGGSLTITRPGNVGDLLVAQIALRSNAAITAPAGWNALTPRSSGTEVKQAIYWKIADGTESTTWTWSDGSDGAGGIIAYANPHPTAPIDFSTDSAGSSATATATGGSAGFPSEMVAAFYTIASENTMTQTSGEGVAQVYTDGTTGGGPPNSRITVLAADGLQAASGTVSSKSASFTSSAWVAHLVAVRQAPDDGDGTLTSGTSAVAASSVGNTLAFTYTAGAQGTVNGAVTIDVPAGWTAPSTTGSDAGYTTSTAGSVSVAGQKITVSGVTLAAGGTMTITYGSKASGGPGATASAATGPVTWQVQQRGTAAGTLTGIAASPNVDQLAAHGSGTETASPGAVAVNATGQTITLTYTAAAGGMSDGAVEVSVPSGWSVPSTSGSDAGYTTASTGTVAVAGQVVTVSGVTLAGGATLTITYGSTAAGGPGATAPGAASTQTWTTRQRSLPAGTLTALASSPAVQVNGTPSATVSLSPSPPATDQILTATATRSDPEGDAVTLTYVWKVDGATVQTTAGTASLTDTLDLSTAGYGDKGQTVSVEVSASDPYSTGSPATDAEVVVNSAPAVSSVSIDQASPQTDDTLTVSISSSDPDSDALTYAYQWRRNGADIAGQTGATLDLSAAGNGDEGDAISVRVTASDGTDTSPAVTSADRTIVNSAPTVSTVSIDQASPQTNDTLTVSVSGSDADGEAVTYAYQWRRNGVDLAGETAATVDLSAAGNGDKGDAISVRVTASDGTDTSPAVTSADRTIVNSAPTVSTVSIDQASPKTNDTLTVSVSSSDPDGDAVTHAYQWRGNGVDISGQTGATLDLSAAGNGDRDDDISVRVTASDGADASPALTSAARTVANSAPVLSAVSVDQASPRTLDTLTYTPTVTDADGDAITYTQQWRRNGADLAGETGATLDLSVAGNGDKGDDVSVRATATDGTDSSGALTSAAVAVLNSAPTIDSAAVNESAPWTDDTLTLSVAHTDDDGDAVTYSYQWQLDGADLSGEIGPTLDLSVAGNGDKGDSLRARVTGSDGAASSNPLTTAAVTVANSAPTIASVSIDQASPKTTDVLSVTVASADADADAVTYSYQWRRNGADLAGETGATLDLSVGGNGDKGDGISVRVTASDGADSSAPSTSAAVTVENSAPTVGTAVIDQASPATNDTLTLSIAASDPDGDALTYTRQWRRNAVDLAGETGASLDLSTAGNGDRGDGIDVRVSASDGTASSAALTSSAVTVANSAPTATVSLSPASPGTDGTLTATATSGDADGDTVTLTYVWKVEGVTVKTTADTASLTDTLDLSQPGNGDPGDTIAVEVTPSDATIDGAPATDSKQVDDGPPDTSIDLAPADPSPDAAPTFSFSADEPATFECRLDGSSWIPCTSPHTTVSLADGNHTFEVRATDDLSNVDASPASHTWVVDTVAPSGGSVAYADGWDSDGSVDVTTATGTDGGSGLDLASAVVERDFAALSLGSCGPFADSWSAVFTPDGSVTGGSCYRYRFSIADNAGNVATYTSASVVEVDLTAPGAPTLTFSAVTGAHTVGTTLWFRPGTPGSFTLTPSSGDAESGVASYSHPNLGTGWSRTGHDYTFTAAAADPNEPNSVTATNGAGLTSPASSFTVTADAAAPVTSAFCDGAPCAPGWYTSSPVSVSLAAADGGAGVKEIRYTTDGTDPTPATGTVYSAPFEVTTGTTTVKFVAIDNVGNVEPVASTVVRIDVTAPTTPTLSLTAGANAYATGTSAWFRAGAAGAFTVAASASDPESGVASYTFPALGAGWSESGGVYSFDGSAADPAEPLEATATNGAGLASPGAPFSVTADADAPATAIGCTGGCDDWHTSVPVNVTLAADDPLSGVKKTLYSTDGSAPSTLYAVPFALSSEGTTTVRFASEDNVGNIEAAQSQDVRIDTVAPVATIDDPGTYVRGTVALTSSQSDATSGVDTVTYQHSPAGAATWTSIAGSSLDTTALANGDHDLRVLVGDVAGNWTASALVQVTVDNLAPSVSLDAPASPATGTVTLTATASDAHSAPVDVEFDYSVAGANDWQDTDASWDTTLLADGAYDLRARGTDQAGNATVSATVAGIQVDNNAPSVSVTAPADDGFVSGAAADPFTVTATADDAGGTGVSSVAFYEWTGGWSLIDTDTTSPYAAAWTLPADGPRRLKAVATDAAGHASEAEVELTVDRTPPTPALGDPGEYLRLGVTLDAAGTADATSGVGSVAFQRSPAGAGTWTTIETDTAAPYTSGLDTTALTDGLYDFRVLVVDAAGNAATAEVTGRRVDNTKPAAGITDPGPYLRGSVGLAGSASDGGSGVATVEFQRSPEGAATWTTIATDPSAPYAATLNTTTLADGVYDFRVVVTDRAGNAETASVGSRRVDNTKPTSAIADPGPNLRQIIALSAAADDVGGSGVATVEFQRSPAGAGTWTTVSTDSDGGNGWSASLNTTTLADGLYDFKAIATDNAGNTQSSTVAGRRVDNTPPSAGIADPGQYLHGSVILTGSADDPGGSGVASVLFRRSPAGGGPWTPIGEDTDGGDGWSILFATDGGVPDGVYDLDVLVTDTAGNSSTAVVTGRMVDNTAPTTTDDAPTSSASPVTVTLTATDAGSGPSATQFRVDGGPWQSGTTVSIAAPADHSNDGVRTIEYYSTDLAGNVEPVRSADVLIDTTGPSGSVGNPDDYMTGLVRLSAEPDDPDDVASVEFEFAPEGSGAWVQIGSMLLAAPFEVDWDTTGVADGAYDLQVTMTDALGNEAITSLPGKTVDNTDPSVALTAPADGAVKQGSIGITASASDGTSGVAEVEFRVRPAGASSFTSVGVDSAGPTWAMVWDSTSSPDGPVEIQAVARDVAGNESTSSSRTITVDNAAPSVTLSAPGSVVGGIVSLTASGSSDIVEVEFRVDGAAIGTDTDGGDGWSVTWATSGDGTGQLTARARDAGGNVGTSPAVTVTVDNTDPSGTMSTPPDGGTVGGPSIPLAADAADSGSGVASVAFQYRSGGGTWTDIAGTTWDATPLATGPYDLRAKIVDNAGNGAFSPAITVQVDSTAPTVVLAHPGGSLSGSVTLTATVSGTDVQQVAFEFAPAGSGSWSQIAVDTAAPWSADFATGGIGDGTYDLRTVVSDAFGNTNESVRAGIRIDNTVPGVASSTPADGTLAGSTVTQVLVEASEALAAVNDLRLDGVPVAGAVSGSTLDVAGISAGPGPHMVSGELEDVAGKTARFRVHFTVAAGYVEKNTSSSASTSLTSDIGAVRVVMPAGAWSSSSGDWLVIRVDPTSAAGAASVVDVTARWALGGGEAHSFAQPIEIVFADGGTGVLPATYEGGNWRVLRRVPSTGSLPGDWQDGFWSDGAGVHIVTRHLSLFGLIADVVPPSPPVAVGVVDPGGLKLRWIPGADDSGLVGQVKLYVDGVGYAHYDTTQTEAKMGPWTAGDTRTFQFTQFDLAGNESSKSKRLVGVPALAGLSFAEARAALAGRGFGVGRVTERESAEAPGTVLEPVGLALAEEGSAVDLVVARGAAAPLPAGQARLVLSVAGPNQFSWRTRTFVASRITSSRAARVTASLISPRGVRLYRWRLTVKPGGQVAKLKMPKQVRRAGTYRLAFTATTPGQTVRKTVAFRIVGKGKLARPVAVGRRPVDVVLTGARGARRSVALGLGSASMRVVDGAEEERAFTAAANGKRNVRVVLVDVDKHGVALVRDLHLVFPSIRLVALASKPADRARSLKAGASVALPHDTRPAAIARIIRRLAASAR